jgi:quinoprotein dehydrogenase-associated probable ABC transporter substrate-binding protein
VCADPNNLPYSNEQQQGFENKLAELLAGTLHRQVAYTWWSQRKGFAKRSLDQGACDVVLGVPSSISDVLTTASYYKSSYVFVSRADRKSSVSSLIDPRLAEIRIGIHVVGDDFAPPAAALASRGITRNIVGFSLFGEYGEVNPARKLIDAVESGDIDLGIAWGPIAGYFAQNSRIPLQVTPISPAIFNGIPFAYQISAAVRIDNKALKTALDQALIAESAEIQRILDRYQVPRVP